MNKKQRKILDAIFRKPTLSNIEWKDVLSLFRHLNAEIIEGKGSSVCFILNGHKKYIHAPHPQTAKTYYYWGILW